MMQAAEDVCHHWIAHVLPLYAVLFPFASSTDLILRVRTSMPSLASSSPHSASEKKSMSTHIKGADLRSCGLSNDLGNLYIVPGW